MEYHSGSSTTHRILVHLVWCPKYRRRVLVGTVAIRLRFLFEQACEVNQWILHELAIERDHIHMLLQINPQQSIAYVVQILKGGSSKVIREEFPELEEFLWGDSLWSDGYFAESVGVKNESTIRTYIQNQGITS